MNPLPPLQVTVDARGWSCILDVRLALARLGPTLALRLAEEARVCLVPTLWDVLDNTAYFEADPEALGSDPLAPELDPALGFDPHALTQWDKARTDQGLAALRIYWAGDALHVSSLPKDVDAEVVRRFDRLGEWLEGRLVRARPDLASTRPARLLEGSIGALALAAAMTRYRPLILTLAPAPDGSMPALCRVLDLCGIPTRRLSLEESRETRGQLAPLLARCGVLDLLWAGLPLVALHLVAPRALLMEGAEDTEPDVREGDDGWQGAAAFWYALP